MKGLAFSNQSNLTSSKRNNMNGLKTALNSSDRTGFVLTSASAYCRCIRIGPARIQDAFQLLSGIFAGSCAKSRVACRVGMEKSLVLIYIF